MTDFVVKFEEDSSIDVAFKDVTVETKEPTLEIVDVTISANDQYSYTPSDGYDGISKINITVDVPDIPPVLESKYVTITENGTTIINPSEGYDGLNSVNITVNVADIDVGGDDSFYDAFWDSYTNNGERTDYSSAFQGAYWTTESFGTPKYVLKPTNAQYMFMSTRITEISEGVLDTSQCTNMQRMFYMAQVAKIPTLDCSSCTSLEQAFSESWNFYFKTDITLINVRADCAFSSAFSWLNNLVNFRITGTIGKSISLSNSPNLSDESVQNIIDCLADLTGQTAQTLTLHSTVKGKLTDAQRATITNKNWTLP